MIGEQTPDDPIGLFAAWLREAEDKEINDPTALALATVGEDGMPSCRMVLLKGHDDRGFVFYTNYESRKGSQLLASAKAAMLFHWKSLRRQVRIEGPVEQVTSEEADAYFASRPRGSQLGAWCSPQSTVISSRSVLTAKLDEIKQKFANRQIPIPSMWGGYRVVPRRFEFWQQGPDRLHDRFQYERTEQGAWRIDRLAP